MHDAGLPVYGGVPTSNSPQAHIVAVGHSLGFDHDSAGDTAMADLYKFLNKRGVKLSIRRDLLRFSFHIYNNEDDIDRTVDLARQWLRQR